MTVMDGTKHGADSIHRESILEQHLVEQLRTAQGYVERTPEDYDRASALDRALVARFVKETQPNEWAKLEAHYTTSSEGEFFKQLDKALKSRSTLDVLRQGIKLIPGIHFSLCFFQPASGLNADLIRLYRANILSVTRQLCYSTKCENASTR
jgi:type I restriction enzyme R subunit